MLLAVLTCQSATEAAQRHYPTWREHFDNIVFVVPVDSKCWVPEGHQSWAIGRDYYNDRDRPDDNLCRRTIETLERFLKTANTEICLIEYDVLLFAKPNLVGDFAGTMFSEMIHPPWIFNRKSATQFVERGNELLEQKVIAGGWPDRHLRLIYDFVLPVTDPNTNYSYNTIGEEQIEDAKHAIRNGAMAIHGIKTKEVFEALTA